LKLYIDQQLPPVLAQWLRDRSVDARHVRELGLKDRPDHEIWNRGIRDEAVVVSRDSDFSLFARQDPRGRLVRLRVGNCGNADLIRLFERQWPETAQRLESGERIVELWP